MKNKNIQIRNYILDLIESGELTEGDRLPGARKIAMELNSSFTHVQAVMESLVQCGVLKAVPRSGTYVDEDWRERILPYNFASYAGDQISVLYELVKDVGEPYGIRACRQFKHGFAELQVSHYLLSHHDEYLDLSGVFREIFGNGDDFFMNAMKDFYVNDKLCGIPLCFSPRVIVYNVAVFKRYGCPLPRAHWTFDEFMDIIKYLRNHMPPKYIFNWETYLQSFSSFFIRFGGEFFDTSQSRAIFANEKGLKFFKQYIQLRDLLGGCKIPDNEQVDKFVHGEAAMHFAAMPKLYLLRKLNKQQDIQAVQLPLFSGGRDINLQAADLLCISKRCTDMDMIKGLVQRMLSEKIQDRLGDIGYGIPLRKSSASKLLNGNSGCNSIFMEEIPKISVAYNIFNPAVYRLMFSGIRRICTMHQYQIADEVKSLANATELIMKIHDFERNNVLEPFNKEWKYAEK